MNVDMVTGSAIEESVSQVYQNSDIVKIFCAGIASGIIFITLVFMISLLINVFFDMIRKV